MLCTRANPNFDKVMAILGAFLLKRGYTIADLAEINGAVGGVWVDPKTLNIELLPRNWGNNENQSGKTYNSGA